MRVTPTRQTSAPTNDRGAATAIFVFFLSAALGLSALVIDVGNGWQERRHLTISTDAAALAAAQDYVKNINGCAVSAGSVVASNNSDATMSSCVNTTPAGSTPGRVTVEAEATVEYLFAGALGFSQTTVTSSTTVSYQSAGMVSGGLRPFGLCAGVLSTLTPTVVPGNNEVYRIYYGKDAQPDTCGDANDIPGNWGILDFDGGANSQDDIKDWTRNGYDGEVSIGDIIQGDPGAFSNALKTELNYLKTVDHFALPVFDIATGNGANADFRIERFAAVRLHDFKANGPEKDRYFEIEFLNEVVQGGGGGPTDGLGAFVIGICAVDGVDPATACS